MTTKAAKLDLYTTHKQEYAAPKKPVLVNLPSASYLTITGKGKPGGPEFEACIGALYAVAYTIKMTRKFAGERDYSVCKLEGQWWADSTNDLSRVPPEEFQWKLMIRTPEFVSSQDLEKAIAVLLKRGKGSEVNRVRRETLEEGTCVQMLHVGPYDKEGESIALMKAFAEKQGCTFRGPHHEVYLSDPRRIAPERLKTILREPVDRIAG